MSPIENFIGTFLEFLSLLLLMSVFHCAYMQWKGRSVCVLILSALVVVASDFAELAVAAQYVINYSFMILLCSLFFRRKIWIVFFEYLFSIAVVAGIELSLITVQAWLLPGPLTFWQRLLHLGILLAGCVLLQRSNRIVLRFQAFYGRYQQSFYLVGFNLFAVFIIEIYFWDTEIERLYENIGVISVFMLLWAIMNLFLLKVLIIDGRNRAIVRAYEKYEEMAEGLLDSLHAEKHEFNRHLQAILRMCEHDRAGAMIREYILEIREKGTKGTRLSVNMGDGLINGLIYSKMQEAKEAGIQLTCVAVSGISGIPCLKHELVEILENVLDNGIEYLESLEAVQRKEFYLEIGSDSERFFIKTRNPYYGDADSVEEFMQKGRTTKAGQRRGYGLYNVKRIVSKYKGTISLYVEDRNLNIEIYFNNSAGHSGSP